MLLQWPDDVNSEVLRRVWPWFGGLRTDRTFRTNRTDEGDDEGRMMNDEGHSEGGADPRSGLQSDAEYCDSGSGVPLTIFSTARTPLRRATTAPWLPLSSGLLQHGAYRASTFRSWPPSAKHLSMRAIQTNPTLWSIFAQAVRDRVNPQFAAFFIFLLF